MCLAYIDLCEVGGICDGESGEAISSQLDLCDIWHRTKEQLLRESAWKDVQRPVASGTDENEGGGLIVWEE